MTYTYDGDGNRVKKSNGTLYWGSGALAESDLTASTASWKDYIFFNGKRVAKRDSTTTHYFFSDHLGSASVVRNDSTGALAEDLVYAPYGQLLSGASADHYMFTGKERDTESGLDNFGARYHGSNMGRFMSPDPLYLELNRLSDPQALNLYSYVRNSPLVMTDPSGMLEKVECSQVTTAQCQQTVTDFNNRDGGQFSVTRDDKTGLLSVSGQNGDPSTWSQGEQDLYNAVTNKDVTGTLTVSPNDSSFDFEKSNGKGQNTVDRNDLNALGAKDTHLPGEVLSHAVVESYNSAKAGVSVDDAHDLARRDFGFRYALFTPNWGTTVNRLFLNWRATRLNVDFRAQMAITPIPRATFNQMQKDGIVPQRDVTSVEILQRK